MKSDFIRDIVEKLHGYRTRVKECHYGATHYNIHKITDDFVEELDSYEDALVENASSLYDSLKPGELNPQLPEALDFENLLMDLRGLVTGAKREFEKEDNLMNTGLITLTDDFLCVIGKYIYLTRIALGKN